MEKKIIIFCSTTSLALIAIVGLIILFNAAFAPNTAMASESTSSYKPSVNFQHLENGQSADVYIDVQPVPEPATICMLGLGGATLVSQRRKRRLHRNRKSKLNLNSNG